MKKLYFLKLGGSLITDKQRVRTVKWDILKRVAEEILKAKNENPDVILLIGHGSGSFGHFPAKKYLTREGVKSEEQWQGFIEVGKEARDLNGIVMDALLSIGLPAVAIPPLGGIMANDGCIESWETAQITAAIHHDLLPVVYGDVCFDKIRGGTIISTEEQFEYLANKLNPEKILLAGIEPGIWSDFPQRTQIIPGITPETLHELEKSISRSESPDVTGGMKSKVHSMMNLIHNNSCKEVLIFSGLETGNILRAISGETIGTRLSMVQKES